MPDGSGGLNLSPDRRKKIGVAKQESPQIEIEPTSQPLSPIDAPPASVSAVASITGGHQDLIIRTKLGLHQSPRRVERIGRKEQRRDKQKEVEEFGMLAERILAFEGTFNSELDRVVADLKKRAADPPNSKDAEKSEKHFALLQKELEEAQNLARHNAFVEERQMDRRGLREVRTHLVRADGHRLEAFKSIPHQESVEAELAMQTRRLENPEYNPNHLSDAYLASTTRFALAKLLSDLKQYMHIGTLVRNETTTLGNLEDHMRNVEKVRDGILSFEKQVRKLAETSTTLRMPDYQELTSTFAEEADLRLRRAVKYRLLGEKMHLTRDEDGHGHGLNPNYEFPPEDLRRMADEAAEMGERLTRMAHTYEKVINVSKGIQV